MLVHEKFNNDFEYFFRKPLFIKSLKESASIDESLYNNDKDELMWCNRCNNKVVNTDNPALAFVTTDDKSTFYVQSVWCEAKKKSI